jgi:hypothetical protein
MLPRFNWLVCRTLNSDWASQLLELGLVFYLGASANDVHWWVHESIYLRYQIRALSIGGCAYVSTDSKFDFTSPDWQQLNSTLILTFDYDFYLNVTVNKF